VAGTSSGGPGWGPAPGAVVAGYRVEARIGAGGMAVVFRARDVGLGRAVALKILAPELAGDREFRERFARESRAVAAVDHPHIIPVYAAGEADGFLYIAMRYVPSGDLRELIRREGQLTAARASWLLAPLASALDTGHLAGLVHRDVKPANILIDTVNGMADHPYLADFGLAKGSGSRSAAGLTGTGQFIGTLDYAAPEQISGNGAVPQTDQYALACAAFTMLAGAAPFPRQEPWAVLWAHTSQPPPPVTALRPDLPRGIDQVLAQAMAKAPGERYATCADFAEAFGTALGLGTLRAGPHSPPEGAPGRPGVTLAVLTAADVPLPQPGPAAALPAAADRPASPVTAGRPMSAPYSDTVTLARPAGAAPQAEPEGQNGGGLAPDDAGGPVIGGDAGGSIRPPASPGPAGRRKRRRALVIATVAAVVVAAGGGGALLAVHPWRHPPVLPPAGLAVQGKATTSSLTIGWSGPVSGPLPDRYEIVRDGTVVGSVPGTVTHYTDGGLAPGSKYRLQVIAVRGGIQSPASRSLAVETALLRPGGLAVQGKATSSLTIGWSGPAAGPLPDRYEIVRGGAVVGSVPGTVTHYTDSGLGPDTPYQYQVIAVRGGEQSPASQPLTGQTTAPPLRDARFDWSGNATYKMQWLSPPASGWDKQPGSSWQDVWRFSPRCSSGPCNATLNGAYDGYSFSSKLTRSGTTYSGTGVLKGYLYCGSPSDSINATLTITLKAKSAAPQGTEWAVESFSGTVVLYVPAEYSCSDDTAQLAVKGG